MLHEVIISSRTNKTMDVFYIKSRKHLAAFMKKPIITIKGATDVQVNRMTRTQRIPFATMQVA